MEKILLVLWPLFALIAFGFIARRQNFFEAGFWYGTEKLNYYLLFPALLINSLASAPLDNPQLPQLDYFIGRQSHIMDWKSAI